MTTTRYHVVTADERGHFASEFFESQHALEAAMAARGIKRVRYTTSPVDRRLRVELQGRPVFATLYGPMWDGIDEDGNETVRYENDKANEIMST